MDKQLKKLLKQSITIEPFTSEDRYGAPTYGAAGSHAARVRGETKIVRTASGEEKVSRVAIWLDSDVTITSKDRITLPADFEVTQPPILAIEEYPGEKGTIEFRKVRC